MISRRSFLKTFGATAAALAGRNAISAADVPPPLDAGDLPATTPQHGDHIMLTFGGRSDGRYRVFADRGAGFVCEGYVPDGDTWCAIPDNPPVQAVYMTHTDSSGFERQISRELNGTIVTYADVVRPH